MLVIIDPSTRHPELEVCAQISQEARRLTQGQLAHDLRVVRPALPQELVDISSASDEFESERYVVKLSHIQPREASAVIILGGGASPAEELAWQTRLKEWLTHPEGPMARGCPILGVCYGHQLLGSISGGAVEFLWSGECAKGLRNTQLSEATLGLEAHTVYPLVISHREGLRDAPSGWRALSMSAYLNGPSSQPSARAVDAMRHEHAPWWGFQAHVDATPQFITGNHIPSALPRPYAGERVIRAFLRLWARSL